MSNYLMVFYQKMNKLLYLNEPNIELELNNVLEECCKSFGLDATSSFRLSDFYLTYRIDDAELHLTNNESLKIAIQFHKDNKIRTVNLTLNKRFSALNNFSVTNADQEYNKGYDNNEFEDKNKQHIMKKEEKRRIFTPLNQNINKKYDTTNLKRKVSKLERSNQGPQQAINSSIPNQIHKRSENHKTKLFFLDDYR